MSATSVATNIVRGLVTAIIVVVPTILQGLKPFKKLGNALHRFGLMFGTVRLCIEAGQTFTWT